MPDRIASLVLPLAPPDPARRAGGDDNRIRRPPVRGGGGGGGTSPEALLELLPSGGATRSPSPSPSPRALDSTPPPSSSNVVVFVGRRGLRSEFRTFDAHAKEGASGDPFKTPGGPRPPTNARDSLLLLRYDTVSLSFPLQFLPRRRQASTDLAGGRAGGAATRDERASNSGFIEYNI
jgi:hypothetical protein